MNYLIIHLIISILIFFLGAKKTPASERIGYVFITFFFPVGGLLIVILLKLLKDHKDGEINEDEFENPIILFTDRINVNEEVNILPITELLTMDDVSIKRKQVIDTLKQDMSGLLDKLKLALRDDDVETSHYAASAISEIKRSMDLKLQQIQRIYDLQHDNLEVVDEYIDVLKDYINSKVYDEISVSRISIAYEEGLKNRINLVPESDATIYNQLISVELKQKKFSDALHYIEDYIKLYNNEDGYIYKMELHYMMRDRVSFKETYNILLNSPVLLTNKGMEIIRFWMEGMKNETVKPSG